MKFLQFLHVKVGSKKVLVFCIFGIKLALACVADIFLVVVVVLSKILCRLVHATGPCNMTTICSGMSVLMFLSSRKVIPDLLLIDFCALAIIAYHREFFLVDHRLKHDTFWD